MAGTDTNKVTINVNGTNLEFTKIGNILGPAGKDGIDGKSIYAKTVDPWSVSGWNPAVAGDLFLNTTTGILWSAKASAVTSNVQSNWTKVGELAGKITVDSALSSTSTNPVQNKVIKSALDGKAGSNHDHDSRYYTESEIDTKLNKKADSGHTHSYLMNSSGRQFNVPTGGNGGEQKTLVITDDLNNYQPKGNYASSSHKHPISDINNLQSTIDGIYTDMGLQDEAIAGKADSTHEHDSRYYTESEIDTKLNKKADSGHSHSYLMNSSGRQFNVPTGGNGGEQKTLVITDDLNAYQPAGNYASSSHTHKKSQITDFPAIPTVNNPTITINQGGTKKGSFTLNQSGAATIDLTDNNTTYTAGTGLSLSNGAFSVKTGYTTNGKNYKVTTDNSGNLYVSVPWANDTWRPVVDNLTTTDATKSLSANQGKVLKDYIDTYFPRAKFGNDSYYSDVSTSFIGGVYNGPRTNGWEFLYRAEHRNGAGDGPNYVMEMVSNLTSDSSIYWRKKTGSSFTSFREIIDSNNIGSQSVKYATSAGSANSVSWGNVSGRPFSGTSFVSGDSGNGEHDANNATANGHYYYYSNGPATSLGASTGDGALYVQSYSSSWVGQIAQDYRNGSLFVRGKNNGSWSSWKRIIDSGNIGSQNVNYANSAGSANSVAWGNVTGKPSTFTPASHTHSSVTDIGNSTATTFAYSKAGLDYSNYTWLAGWNGYELRAVNKSQFATASHTHTKSQITDFPTKLPASNISMSFSNGVLTITYN